MFFNNKKKIQSVDEKYEALRNKAFDITPEQLGLSLDEKNKNQVYSAIIDMPVTDRIVTLVCFFDGTTSLYFSNGGGILGAGQKHDSIRKATGDFLLSSGQAIPFMAKAFTHELPHDTNSVIYLKCGEGIYATSFDMAKQQTEKYKQFLNFLVQRVLKEFRESGEM